MEFRVSQLAARAGVSVDTVRFYQSRGLLPPPRRAGRVALYGDEHLARLEHIRAWQARGLNLSVIGRLLHGELEAADEALAAALTEGAGAAEGDEERFDISELAARSGIPLALLQAVARDGLLVPRLDDGEPRYTAADVEVAAAGLGLLEHGLPLAEVLDLARQHHAAMRAVAERAVDLFDTHIRQPLRRSGAPPDEAAERLVEAFVALLPATTTLVAHHFRRVLLAVAHEHITHVGDAAEVEAVQARAQRGLESWPA